MGWRLNSFLPSKRGGPDHINCNKLHTLNFFFFTSGQTPDNFGYVKPTSNQPFDPDLKEFYRSASSAADIRAKQLEKLTGKTKSLPPARMCQCA